MEGARFATPADLGRVLRLRAEATVDLVSRRGGRLLLATSPQPDFARLAGGDGEAAALVVGTLDEEVVGYAAASVTQTDSGARLGAVDELFVEAEGRGVGVGEAMLRRLMAWCAAHGCTQMDGRALPGDRDTKALFEAHGFSARLLIMSRPLPPAGEGGDGDQDG